MNAGSPEDVSAPPRGHITDLEGSSLPEWWRTLFGPSYLLTDGDVLSEENTSREVDLFVALLGLDPSHRILDLCCGQGRHALELARRGFLHVEGLDYSAFLIGEAQRSARRARLQVKFHEGDSRRLPFPDHTFDAVIIAGNSFGFFDAAADDERVLREIHRVLGPRGRVLLDLADGDHLRAHFQPHSWEWLDDEHFACRERTRSSDGTRLISREIVTHVERGVLVDQIYAERLYGVHDIEHLLRKMAFDNIVFGGHLKASSERDQDLGMMEHRYVVMAEAVPPRRAAPHHQAPPTLRVTVVMGDPRMGDPVKVDGIFGEDDLHTIESLKEALGTLRGYRFRYLDAHPTLLDDLRRIQPTTDLVLNLCDEGFRNDARQELHVPALLDVIGLPYSGATPQGLAFCYDKSLVRGIAGEMGVPVPEALFAHPELDPLPEPEAIRFPVIVKPNLADSGVGITQQSVARNHDELMAAIAAVRRIVGSEEALLIESFLTGMDLTVGLLGNPGHGLRVLPITEDDYSGLPPALPHVCGYEAKWLFDSPYLQQIRTVPARLPEQTSAFIREKSVRLFSRLGCRDYARFDWRLDADGRPFLLEANPNPGWCWDGHLAKQAELDGISYSEMLGLILDGAARRYGLVSPPVYSRPRAVAKGVNGS